MGSYLVSDIQRSKTAVPDQLPWGVVRGIPVLAFEKLWEVLILILYTEKLPKHTRFVKEEGPLG
jgi:hypothetical protein